KWEKERTAVEIISEYYIGESSSSRTLAIIANATEAMNDDDSADLIVSSQSEDNTIHTMLHVRTLSGNEWFATGGADLIVKIWDLANRKLRLSLLGHGSAVTCCKISRRQALLFMGGEDKQVKCWDRYSVEDLIIHPSIDVLITCARDSAARVGIYELKIGHPNTVAAVIPQKIITGNHDSTIRLWNLVAGQSICTLMHHKKST
ncbi:unnamed protein product, partial [Onchocerca flexuosa]|uniref:WD_REPEATS_REGION domain-containing protein n=1 Tax=Onchocerca flexuosa TaxID=387005 RepID=A0A183GZS2_9BILA